ncbi:MAG: M48 family metalloprotease [Rickettsiales bacterium]
MFKKILFFTIIIFCHISNLHAINLIRDAQTEAYLEKISSPIFKAANLDKQIKLYIVNDENINAFVAGGKNIFLNTGTIIKANSPLSLIGIIAHETGHITGSHLARMSIDLKKINAQMALGYIIGMATLASGQVDAGQAVILGSSQIAERQYYKHSIKHEEAADEAALKLLDQGQFSAKGLLNFFEQLKTTEKLNTEQLNPYTRTHPLTLDRINRIAKHLETSPYSKKPSTVADLAEFNLIKTKLKAFLEDPLTIIKEADITTENGKLAIIIAKHRLGRSLEALELFSYLAAKNNPYMQELKGQIEYESGIATAAVKTLLAVEEQLPESALIKIELAAAIISAQKQDLYNYAIAKLNQALIIEKENVSGWRNISRLYNLTAQTGLSLLALAEAEFFAANYLLAIKYATNAKKILTKSNNSASILRAEDIIKFSKEQEDV